MAEQTNSLGSAPTRRFKHVFQRNGGDCGVACVAMVAGVTYEAAAAAFASFGSSGRHTYAIDLQRALAVFGVETGARLRGVSKRRVHGVTVDAILKVNCGKFGCHWIVWDAEELVVLDPSVRPKRRYRLSAYLPVIIVSSSATKPPIAS